MAANKKPLSTIAGLLLVIVGAAGWTYWHEFNAPQHDLGLHRRVGEVMADQTAMVVGTTGKIVLITIPTRGEPELKTQLDAFHKRLKQLGHYRVREYELDTKDQDKYGVGTGLSGRRYVRTANKNLDAAAIVSFVGAPSLKDEDFAELQRAPKLVAQARSVDNLSKLFEKQLISVAVASRFTFPAPGPVSPRTAQERFDKRYQVVVATNVASTSKPE